MPRLATRKNLTVAAVEKIGRKPGGATEHWDTNLSGFGLRVSPKGRKVYFLRRRLGKRHMRLTWDAASNSVDEAREKARQAIRAIERGKDPTSRFAAIRTVRELAACFMAEHVSKKRAATRESYQRNLDRHVLPELGDMLVVAVDHRHVEDLHRKITEGGGPGSRKPARYCANRAAAVLSAMFTKIAIKRGIRSDNPVRGLERNPEEKRQLDLKQSELQRLTAALDARADPRADAVRLLLLTGARRGETLTATWAQFDLDKGTWTKPSAYTKQKAEHRVPLSAAAVELLKRMRERAPEGEDRLFPGEPNKVIEGLKRFWRGIRKAAALPDLRIHDLRHAYASILASSGLSLPIIGALLGHTQAQTTMRYAHLFDEPLRAATERVSAAVTAASAKPGGNVFAITGKAATG